MPKRDPQNVDTTLWYLNEEQNSLYWIRRDAFERMTVSYVTAAMYTHPEVQAMLELRVSPWWKKWIEGYV